MIHIDDNHLMYNMMYQPVYPPPPPPAEHPPPPPPNPPEMCQVREASQGRPPADPPVRLYPSWRE